MYLSQHILKKVNMMLVVCLLISTNLITSFAATSTNKDNTMTDSEEEIIEESLINQGASVYNHAYQENYNTALDCISSAVQYYNQALTLPLFASMKKEEVEAVVWAVKDALSE